MELTQRQSSYMDQKFGEYLDRCEYRSWTSSAKASVTGFVSSCCNTETRVLSGDRVACIECGRVCDTRSWWSPLGGAASRGGWDPSPVWKLVDGDWALVPRDQVMYINPTESRNIYAQDSRLARGADSIKELSFLFQEPPRGRSLAYWNRTKLAWHGWWSGVGSYSDVAALAVIAGRDRDAWTAENVETWIVEGREAAHSRLDRARERPSEHPWAKAAWLAYELATKIAKRKRAA